MFRKTIWTTGHIGFGPENIVNAKNFLYKTADSPDRVRLKFSSSKRYLGQVEIANIKAACLCIPFDISIIFASELLGSVLKTVRVPQHNC